MTKQEQIDEIAKIIANTWLVDLDGNTKDVCEVLDEADIQCIARELYGKGCQIISEDSIVLTKEELVKTMESGYMYDTTRGNKINLIEMAREIERKETAREILLPLRRFLIKRFDYFGELGKRNEGVSPDNRLFDLGEQDMANCTLDRVNELLEKYGVEIEE